MPGEVYYAKGDYRKAKDQGDYIKAEACYQRVVAMREKRLDKNHPLLGNCLTHLAGLARNLAAKP